ncbi:hypothetical protein Tco_0695347 [Tanacetum coccineum]
MERRLRDGRGGGNMEVVVRLGFYSSNFRMCDHRVLRGDSGVLVVVRYCVGGRAFVVALVLRGDGVWHGDKRHGYAVSSLMDTAYW